MEIVELKQIIRTYLSGEGGNNLKSFLSEKALKELKQHLTDLKEALSDEE